MPNRWSVFEDFHGAELRNIRLQQLTSADDWEDKLGGVLGFMSANGDKRLGYWDDELNALIKVLRHDRNESIQGQWSYAPTTAQAPFTLGPNAQGQRVTGLNADQLSDGAGVGHALSADHQDPNTVPLRLAGGQIRTANPSHDFDATPRKWVMDQLAGKTGKLPTCEAATTGNIDLSNPPASFDGIDAVLGKIYMVWLQTNKAQNGLWVYNGPGAQMTRHPALDESDELFAGRVSFVDRGVTVGNRNYQLIDLSDAEPVIDVTEQNWDRIDGALNIETLSGLGKAGDSLFVHIGNAGNPVGSQYTANALVVATGNSTLGFVPVGGNTQVLKGVAGGIPTWGKVALDADVQNVLTLANGGTGADLSGAQAGSIIYHTGAGFGATGQLTGLLRGNGASAPSAVTGAANQVTFWSDANTLSHSANLTWDGTLLRVTRNATSSVASFVQMVNPNTTDGNAASVVGLTDTTGTGGTPLQALAHISFQFDTHNHATRKASIRFATSNNGGPVERWAITPEGILQSSASQTIRGGGTLTLDTLSNGNIVLSPHGTGFTRINSNVGVGADPLPTSTFQMTTANRQFLTVLSAADQGTVIIGTAGNLTDGGVIGRLVFSDRGGNADHQHRAWFQVTADGATANQRGGRIAFWTKTDAGGGGLAERFAIAQNGHVTPGANGTQNFGATGTRWATGFFTALNTTSLTVGGLTTSRFLRLGSGGIIESYSCPTSTILGRVTLGSGDVEELSPGDVKTLLNYQFTEIAGALPSGVQISNPVTGSARAARIWNFDLTTSQTTYNFTTNAGTRKLGAWLYDNVTNEIMSFTDLAAPTDNTVQADFRVAPSANRFTLIVVG